MQLKSAAEAAEQGTVQTKLGKEDFGEAVLF